MFRPLLCVSFFTGYVTAIAFPAPATSCAEVGHLLSPPEPTEGLRKPPVELLRRDATTYDLVAPDNTCGFISGLAGAAYYCESITEKCAFLPGASSSPGFVACCNTQVCGARITCVDYVAFYSSSVCDNGCVKDTFTLKCTSSTAPYCNGISFVDVNARDYFCDSNTVTSWQTASTDYSGDTIGRKLTTLTITPSASTTSLSSASLSTTSTTGSGGSSTTSTASTSTSAPPSGGSSTPIGPIVGGVVGGVGGIILICLLVILLVRHNDKKKKNAANANTGAASAGYVQPQGPNNPTYAAATSDKPAATAQDQALSGQWVPAPITGQYTSPQMQQGQYQPVHQQQYPPVAEMQGNIYHPQQSGLAPAGYPASNQSPGQTYSHPTSPGQVSANSGHLSSAYPDNNDTTNPMSNRRSELLGSEAQGPQGPSPVHSPAPTFATTGTATSPAAGGAPVPQTQSTEGRAEMSANMTDGPFPSNLHDGTFEVPGDVGYHG